MMTTIVAIYAHMDSRGGHTAIPVADKSAKSRRRAHAFYDKEVFGRSTDEIRRYGSIATDDFTGFATLHHERALFSRDYDWAMGDGRTAVLANADRTVLEIVDIPPDLLSKLMTLDSDDEGTSLLQPLAKMLTADAVNPRWDDDAYGFMVVVQ